MYCLDTNIIVDIMRKDVSLKSKVEEMKEIYDVFITTISLCELYKGAYGHAKSDEQVKIIEEFISNFELLSLDKASSKEFGKSYKLLQKDGNITKDFDLIIACIVKINGLTLITRDKKHFKNLGIKVEEW